MTKYTKKQKIINEELQNKDTFKLDEAIVISKKFTSKKFDESLDISIILGIDAKKSDQQIRGVLSLPKMPEKKVKVAVFADGDDIKKSKDAGAEIVGSDDLIEMVKKGEINFDKCISTPKMMVKVSSLGQILGPKGLMPNPKLGTVTNDIKKAVTDAKSGQVEIRNDKDGNIGVSIGKKSFHDDQLLKNFHAILDALEKEKSNNTLKGDLIKNTFVTSSMGVSYKVKLGKSI